MKTKEEIDELYHKLYTISIDGEDNLHYYSFVEGYTQCQEDNKPFFTEETWNIMCSRISELQSELNDKKYTEEDMSNLWQYVIDGAKSILLGNVVTIGKFEDYINSLNKQD